jgi:hypothetical protein
MTSQMYCRCVSGCILQLKFDADKTIKMVINEFNEKHVICKNSKPKNCTKMLHGGQELDDNCDAHQIAFKIGQNCVFFLV